MRTTMRVTKRDGSLEEVSFDKVLRRIQTFTDDLEGADVFMVAQKVVARIYDKVPTRELDELAAQICSSLMTEHPDYGVLAARITISNHHKNTSPSFSETITTLYHAKDIKGDHTPLVSEELYEVVMANKEKLNNIIDYQRDFQFDYFGFKTLERSYLMRVNGVIVERPQHMFMRVALGIHGADLKDAIETYNLMTTKKFTHATPTLFNAGTPRAQMSSCYLMDMRDSIQGIYKTITDAAQISKYAGGIGIHVQDIRARGSYIKGTNGTSTGIIPMLRVLNNTARYVNQGSKRNGSIAVYLEPWHADIEAFLDLRKNHGNEEERCRDLFTALWVPDLFMKRVQANADWSLMCPSECPGLSDAIGEDFERLYEQYEREGRARSTIKAQQLWFAMIKSQIETGTPYVMFKDHANRKSNQKNLGTIKSSNLCVAPETMILTDKGYFPIKDLVEQEINVWNGEEFSKTVVKQTGRMQKLIRIGFSNGMELRCTPYHKFYIETGSRPAQKSRVQVVEAKDLKIGMRTIRFKTPTLNNGTETMVSPYTHGLFCAEGTYSGTNYERPCMFRKAEGSDFCKRHSHYKKSVENGNMCSAMSGEDIPVVFLYGEKKKLLPHVDNVYSFTEENNDRITVGLHHDIDEKFFVPMNSTVSTKIRWLEGYLDGDGCIVHMNGIKNIQVSSVELPFLRNVALMLQTLGVTSSISKMHEEDYEMLPDGKGGQKLYKRQDCFRLNIDSLGLLHLQELGFSPKRLDIQGCRRPHHITNRFITITKIEDKNEFDDTYCFNEPKRHAGIFNGVLTGQCSEIVEYSDENEHAVCNLGSICLPMFIKPDGSYDFAELHRISQVVTKNLNKVIDRNFYPTPETKYSNLRHRPIGIGVQGLADTYALMRMPFDSSEAAELNSKIFETIYHGACTASIALAKKRREMIEELQAQGTSEERKQELEKQLRLTEDEQKLPAQWAGAYATFAGSPTSEGKFQFDLWTEDTRPLSGLWDWEALREEMKTYGIRNSLLLAPMPTASTSQIMGFSECFEPFSANIYQRRTLAGEFFVIRNQLIKDLIKLGIWNKNMKDLILADGGSIQNIPEIPEDLKAIYKTVWEIKQKVLIDQAADRGRFICQSQSMNLFLEEPDLNKVSSMLFYSWRKGVITALYYLRTRPSTKTAAFTLDPALLKSREEQKQVDGPACRKDNPECEACSA